ncbi:hypothetical protein EV175_004551 [Coemansia sp. RSA 1933]|nr:hypothetical protein EV175_004551 [Coemansia sp. RSA 1933]
MPQEEPILTRDQITAEELALIHQMRTLEIRREQYVQRPGGHPPLSLIKYSERRYLEVRQGFQPILVPEHMVTTVRSFLAANLPQHIQMLREQRGLQTPDTPMSMSSVASGAIAPDLRLPPAVGSPNTSILGSSYQLAEPASPLYSHMASLPMAAVPGSPPFDQFGGTNGPFSPMSDEMGSPPQVAPSLPRYDTSSLFTTVPSQGVYDHTSAAASFMATLPGLSQPGTTASMQSMVVPSSHPAAAGGLGLMSSPPQSLSSSYTVPHDFGSHPLPLPLSSPQEEAATPSSLLLLTGTAAKTNNTRKVSGSTQRKVSRSIARKQKSVPYLDTNASLKNSTASPLVKKRRSDAGDDSMEVDDGYEGDGNYNDDTMSTTSSSNNNKNEKDADTKLSILSEDDDDEDETLRKPPNAFILYRRMKNEKLRSERPGISVETASGVIGKLWREEPDEVKREFHEQASKAREAYFAKKKRVQARQKQKKLERDGQQQQKKQQQEQHGSLVSSPSSSGPKAKKKSAKSLSSPPPSLVISTSRNLSSFSPESLAKKLPASGSFPGTVSVTPPVRMTRSLSDTYNNSSSASKRIIRESITMPVLGTSHLQSAGSLSTLLEHSAELGASHSQLGRSLTPPDMDLHVSATVASLKQAFDEAQRSQPTSPVAQAATLGGVGGQQWPQTSQPIESHEWEGVFNKLFPGSS